MGGGSGLDVLRAVQESDPTTSVIFLTAVGTVELAVESMRQGAFDFLTKPYAPDVMLATIRRACERTALSSGECGSQNNGPEAGRRR